MDEIKSLDFLVTTNLLLRREVECLRSVISEFDGDKSEYLQMNRAEIYREVVELLDADFNRD